MRGTDAAIPREEDNGCLAVELGSANQVCESLTAEIGKAGVDENPVKPLVVNLTRSQFRSVGRNKFSPDRWSRFLKHPRRVNLAVYKKQAESHSITDARLTRWG